MEDGKEGIESQPGKTEAPWLTEVTWAGDNVFLGTDYRGHAFVYDSKERDQTELGMSPMRALLSSLGACSGMDVVAILGKRKQRLRSLKVLLRGTRPEFGYPKPWQTIEVKYRLQGEDLDRKYVDEAIGDSMSKFCSVAATLKPGVKITYSYELVESDNLGSGG
jgi:putative redox protein